MNRQHILKMQEIKEWCIELGIYDYEIRSNEDGFYVDVYQNVNIKDMRLKFFPFKFGNVMGNFDCGYNLLTTLKGAPDFVDGSFRASFNRLTNLDYFPKEVARFTTITNNQLTSLVGLPRFNKTLYITDVNILWCYDNPIKNEDYYHLFDLGYDVKSIKTLRDFDLETIKRQWVIHNIITS